MKTAKQMAEEATGLTPLWEYYFTDKEFKQFCAQLLNEFELKRTGTNMMTGFENLNLKTGKMSNITYVELYLKELFED